MNRIVKYAVLCCFAVSMSVSCIRNGEEFCDTYVRFVYDYNIGGADMDTPGIDLFHIQASKIDLFIFDGQGIYVDRITETASSGTFPADFRITLPRDLPGNVQMVAWSGLYEEYYSVTDMVKGQSRLEDLQVSARTSAGNILDKDIKPLWNGSALGEQSLVKYINDVITINLVKNTNNIRINLEVIDEDNNILSDEEFSIEITSANKAYRYDNEILSSTDVILYEPFYTGFDESTGVAAELKLLRLMGDRESVLKITHEDRDEVILEKDIIPYLYASRLNAYRAMGKQEYLDREDTYRIIVFLTYKPGPGPGDGQYVATQIKINEWYVRLHDEGLDPRH
jgi:Protein of unknown function (DUF1812).